MAWIDRLQTTLQSDAVFERAAALLYGLPKKPAKPSGKPVRIQLDMAAAAKHRVSERFISFAIDSSQLVGGHWWSRLGSEVEVGTGAHTTPPFDFGRPRLRRLTEHLTPATLRIGGSEADRLYYDLGEVPRARAPKPYPLLLTRRMWDELTEFVEATGLGFCFTVNAGPGPRDTSGRWTADNARELLTYAKRRGTRVDLWELGNELNLFWFLHGKEHRVTGADYARDFMAFRRAVCAVFPDARFAAPSSFYWPIVGEPAGFEYAVLDDFMPLAGHLTDVVSWHYYPQQSRRCHLAPRRASPTRMLDPRCLDDVLRWAAHVSRQRDRFSPGSPVWLGETGNAQCGGEPGVSDAWAGSLWWLDMLGSLAARGVDVVVRQTLAGATYGLIEDETLTPRPDYFCSVLWKRLMGPEVLDVRCSQDDPWLRAYAHRKADGKVTLLLLNVSPSRSISLRLLGLPTRARVYTLDAASLTSTRMRLDGRELVVGDDDQLPPLEGAETTTSEMTLGPATARFLEWGR